MARKRKTSQVQQAWEKHQADFAAQRAEIAAQFSIPVPAPAAREETPDAVAEPVT